MRTIKPSSNGHDFTATARVRAIKTWMQKHCPTAGVDALLSRPFLAMQMSLEILSNEGFVEADAFALKLEELAKRNSTLVEQMNHVCCFAMNQRKQGKLGPHAPSPGTRAAETRRLNKRAKGGPHA